MFNKRFYVVLGAVMVFGSALFATQRTAVLVTVVERGFTSDSSSYFIKTSESLGGACTSNTLYWSTATDAGKSAIATLGFFLNRGTKVKISYNDSLQTQASVQILDPIQ
ncbi:MAG: hypothetical protein PHC61_00745 [Chitinivibrionales bacterium]|nr:hypothetical protein [Chitinivibrionales bacterium]